MLDNGYGSDTAALQGTVGSAGETQQSFAADLSRGAWDSAAGCRQPQSQQPENLISRDQSGHITQMVAPDGTIYDYSKFQVNGQPSEVHIIDSMTGDWGQWKREEDGLWRSYHENKPNYEVVYGEWVVDSNGQMHMDGRQSTKELPPKLTYDAEGHITRSKHEDGVVYDYSKFDENGQPTVCKITDSKTGDWGYWKKEGDHLWRSYDKEKPNYEVLRGDWTVDDKGVMHMDGVQDSLPLPRVQHHNLPAHAAGNLPAGPPEGYRSLRGRVTPAITAEAKSLLGGAIGTETPFEIDGKKYMARVEPHPPEDKPGLNKWHKGVSVYEAKEQ